MLQSLASKVVIHFPWIPLLLLIPFCLIYDCYHFVRIRINSLTGVKRRGKHAERVRHVQEQVRAWHAAGKPAKMCTARPGYKSITLQTLTYKDKLYQIEVDLHDILHVDHEKRVVHVEPSVTIGQLNDYLISKGWTLPVVPELDDLTIGGLVMGGGIESTSHKYGLLQYICRSYEMVLADASKVTCSAKENPELYSAIPFSYGTLGFLTAVEIDIIPFKPFIELTYIPVYSLDEAARVFKRETEEQCNDSVEGILFAKDRGVIMSGNFIATLDECSTKSASLNRIGRWYKPWFYKHVETFLSTEKLAHSCQRTTEIIPTYDFYHRHNRSCFWILSYIIPFGNSPWFRYLFGWTLPPKHALIKLLKEKFIPAPENGAKDGFSNFVCQDFGVGIDDLGPMLHTVHKETQVYPIWLCPTRHLIPEGLEHLAFFRKEDLHIDVGVYGFTKIPGYDKVESQRRMERFAIDHRGYVALYAETQLTREDFDEMLEFSLRTYHKLRKELDCDSAFPHVYEKISRLGRR